MSEPGIINGPTCLGCRHLIVSMGIGAYCSHLERPRVAARVDSLKTPDWCPGREEIKVEPAGALTDGLVNDQEENK